MGIASAAEEALWWLGWHRRKVLSAGATVGLLVGYSVGGLGVAGLVAGLLLSGVGALRGRALVSMAVVLSVGAAASVIFGLAETAEGSGYGRAVSGIVGSVIGTVGVESPEPLSLAENVLTAVSSWYLAGLAVGVAVWSAGAAVVNRTYRDSYDAFRDLAEKKGEAILGEGTRTSFNGTGSVLGIRPSREYHASSVRVRPNSIDLNYGSTLSMPRKAVSIRGSTKHLYYDQLSSVDYDKPHFEIRMAGGEVIRVVTEERPTETLERIERYLERYKTEAESDGEEVGRDRAEADGREGAAEPGRRAEEAVEEIERVESLFNSELDGIEDVLEISDGEMETEESQVEFEKG